MTNPYSATPGGSAASSITRGAWMALLAAFLGWMFDGLEIGLFPLVARPAMTDLLRKEVIAEVASAANADEIADLLNKKVGLWIGVMTAVFLVGAATGGVVFGWLGDRIGRVRAMTLSVLAYTLFMGLCGLSRSVHDMALYRFIASMGMGGEWSLGVALVMEIWPNQSRAKLAGLIGAAANVGFLAIAVVGMGIGQIEGANLSSGLSSMGLPQSWVDGLTLDSAGNHTNWRLLMLFGAAPALLTFFIRLVVPESERWLHAKSQGATSNWATRDLLGVLIGACGPLLMIYLWADELAWAGDAKMAIRIVGSILGIALAIAGYSYPVYRFVRRAAASGGVEQGFARHTLSRMMLGAGLSAVALIGTWASLQQAVPWVDKLVQQEWEVQTKAVRGDPEKAKSMAEVVTQARSHARSLTQIIAAIGAIVGTIAAALLGDAIGRRPAYCLMCLGSLASSLIFFQFNTKFGPTFLVAVFVAGGLTASFYGWLPLYLPELFRTSVRATGQGFGFNFGRILAAVAALQTGNLLKAFNEDYPLACSIMSLVYLVGAVLIWFAPETRGQPLPD